MACNAHWLEVMKPLISLGATSTSASFQGYLSCLPHCELWLSKHVVASLSSQQQTAKICFSHLTHWLLRNSLPLQDWACLSLYLITEGSRYTSIAKSLAPVFMLPSLVQGSRSGKQTGLQPTRERNKSLCSTKSATWFLFTTGEQMLVPAGDWGQHQCKVVAWVIQQTTAQASSSAPTTARNRQQESGICQWCLH